MSTPDIHYLTDRELDELLRMVTNPKHRVLILIMADAGLRVSECVALRYDNFDFRKQILRVKSLKKRDKSALRDIPISERLYHALADYIATKKAGETSPENWLFPNPTDPSIPIQRFAVNRMLERLRAENPAFRHLHPHALRHTFATRHLATGTRLESIKTMLGHARYDTTLIYTHIPIEQLRRVRPRPLWCVF